MARSFSERHGHVRRAIQREYMDSRLKNRFWNTLCRFLQLYSESTPPSSQIIEDLWMEHWAQRGEMLSAVEWERHIEVHFYGCKWHQVYSALEFLAERLPRFDAQPFITECNRAMEEEKAAYRFVGTRIMEITSETEIASIEQALEAADAYPAVQAHLDKAVGCLAKRPHADYENAVKESINAVEALSCLIAAAPKADLRKALSVLQERNRIHIHPVLHDLFLKLYAYTSDESGVRHKVKEVGEVRKVGLAEAQYMLVSCSAFISYLVSKAAEAQVELGAD